MENIKTQAKNAHANTSNQNPNEMENIKTQAKNAHANASNPFFRDCKKLDTFLFCSTQPIIEASSALR